MESVKGGRSEWILQTLLREGEITVPDLAQRLNVSPTTVRRELRALEAQGLLRRTHGGGAQIEGTLYEPFRYDASFQDHEQLHAEEKRRIGLMAASLVQEGETIAISAGTTATQVARCLRYRTGITILTNAVNIAMELSQCRGITVVMTGGVLSGGWFSLLGAATLRSVEEMFVDRAFIGLDGVHPEYGVTAKHPDEAAVNQAMARQARQTVAVADRTKVGQVARIRVCPLSDIDLLITDLGLSDAELAPFAPYPLEICRA
jgi:DeoR family transcriptional regulator, aga operon transcriptional repressor